MDQQIQNLMRTYQRGLNEGDVDLVRAASLQTRTVEIFALDVVGQSSDLSIMHGTETAKAPSPKTAPDFPIEPVLDPRPAGTTHYAWSRMLQ